MTGTVTRLSDRRPEPLPTVVEVGHFNRDPTVLHVNVHGRYVGGACVAYDDDDRPTGRWCWWSQSDGEMGEGSDRDRAVALLLAYLGVDEPYTINHTGDPR